MFFLALKNKRKGFTLVEMMVAIAVFSIVMVTAMSALLNVIDANNKARAIKTAINNVNFALESISKDMRMGTDYACGKDDADPSGDCDGGNIIKYRSPRAEIGEDGRKFVWYKYNKNSSNLEECLEKDGVSCSFFGPFTSITSSEVTLTNVKFYVSGTDSTAVPKTQPRMILAISGTAGPANKPKLQTTFDLQTSVSQRARR